MPLLCGMPTITSYMFWWKKHSYAELQRWLLTHKCGNSDALLEISNGEMGDALQILRCRNGFSPWHYRDLGYETSWHPPPMGGYRRQTCCCASTRHALLTGCLQEYVRAPYEMVLEPKVLIVGLIREPLKRNKLNLGSIRYWHSYFGLLQSHLSGWGVMPRFYYAKLFRWLTRTWTKRAFSCGVSLPSLFKNATVRRPHIAGAIAPACFFSLKDRWIDLRSLTSCSSQLLTRSQHETLWLFRARLWLSSPTSWQASHRFSTSSMFFDRHAFAQVCVLPHIFLLFRFFIFYLFLLSDQQQRFLGETAWGCTGSNWLVPRPCLCRLKDMAVQLSCLITYMGPEQLIAGGAGLELW